MMTPKLWCVSEALGGLAEIQIADPVSLGWGLRMCIPSKLPGDADIVRTIL